MGEERGRKGTRTGPDNGLIYGIQFTLLLQRNGDIENKDILLDTQKDRGRVFRRT